MAPVRLAILSLAVAAAGCAPRTKDAERPAASLVYSPAARITAQDEATRRTADVQQLQPGRICRVHFRRDAAG